MDKALAYGAGDCRFESCRGHCDRMQKLKNLKIGIPSDISTGLDSGANLAFPTHQWPTKTWGYQAGELGPPFDMEIMGVLLLTNTTTVGMLCELVLLMSTNDTCGVRTHALSEWRLEPPP